MVGLTVPDADDVLVREDAILLEVRETTSLFNQRRRKTVGIGLVVNEFRVDEVVDL
jgi:hypothetical protein